MKINVSMAKDYRRCPTYCYHRNFKRRGLARASDALRLGTHFHAYMEAKLLGKLPPEPALEGKAQREWTLLEPFAAAWQKPEDWEILMVEKALEWPLGHHTFQGRLDALIRRAGGHWSLQWKTCESTTNLPTFSEGVRIGWHECMYQWLAEQQGYTPFHGTVLVTAKKLSAKAIEEHRNPIAVHYLPRSRAMVEERVRHFSGLMQVMALDMAPPSEALVRAHDHARLKDPDFCHGFYGNRPCEYFAVCHESASLADAPFINLEDRYKEETNEG